MSEHINIITILSMTAIVTTFLIPIVLDIFANVYIGICDVFNSHYRFSDQKKYKKIVFPNGHVVTNASVHNVTFSWVHYKTDDGIVAVKKRSVKNLIRFT